MRHAWLEVRAVFERFEGQRGGRSPQFGSRQERLKKGDKTVLIPVSTSIRVLCNREFFFFVKRVPSPCRFLRSVC